MLKKLNGVLFSSILRHITTLPVIQTLAIQTYPLTLNYTYPYNQYSIMSEIESPQPQQKVPRKRRTPEEIAVDKAEKELKKREKEESAAKRADELEMKRQRAEIARVRKELHSTPLSTGKGLFAIAAMTIFDACRRNMPRTNLAFRHMFASRLIFPPKKNINKFATGGVAEECVSQLFCDIGFECVNLSEDVNVIDLAIKVPIIHAETPVDFKVSLKSSGKLSASPILENYRGQKRQEIRALPPTFIIYTEVDAKRARIVYLDEEILLQGYPDLIEHEFNAEIYANNDSNLTFKSGFLAKFIPRLPAEYILDAEFPEDLAGLEERNFSRLALSEVVRQLSEAK